MKKIKNILNNDKTGKKVLILQIIGVFVLTLGFTLALNYISKSINASLTTANINVIYVGDSNITKDLFLPISASEIEQHSAIANFTVKGAESNPTDKDIIYDITLTNIDITDGLHGVSPSKWSYIVCSTLHPKSVSNILPEKSSNLADQFCSE